MAFDPAEPAARPDGALAMAARGCRQFIVTDVQAKKPPVPRFFAVATADPESILKLAAFWPGHNFGTATGRDETDPLGRSLVCIDIDRKIGPDRQLIDGFESLEALDLSAATIGALKNTLRVSTPNGGQHVLFWGPPGVDFQGGVDVLGPALDIRAHHNYIVTLGAVAPKKDGTGLGRYELVKGRDAPILDLPNEIAALLKRPRAATPGATEPLVEPDQPAAIERAMAYLATAEPAVLGSGNNRTYATALALKDFGLSEQAVFDLMFYGQIDGDKTDGPAWNDRCSPPWEADELAAIIGNAFRYGQNPPGVASPEHIYRGVKLPEVVTPEAAGAAGTWEEPDLDLLADALDPAPAFPRDMLGPATAWCEANARAANAPLDYVAAALLTIAGALIGNARVAAMDQWAEPPILWTGLVGPPSSGKSPALEPLQRQLADFEAEWARGFRDTLRAYEGAVQLAKASRAAWEARFKDREFRQFGSFDIGKRTEGGEGNSSQGVEANKGKYEKYKEREVIKTGEGQLLPCPLDLSANVKAVKAAKTPKDPPQSGAIAAPSFDTPWSDLPEDAVMPEEPVRPRLMIGDATVESVAVLSAGNRKGLLMIRDELAGWWRNFNKYAGNGGGDAQFWLSAWGAKSYTVDRRKLAGALQIPRLSVGVLGGVQPDLVAQLLAREADGLAERFLWVYPEPNPGFLRSRVPPDHEPMKRAMARLWCLQPEGAADSRQPVRCDLAPDAADAFEGWVSATRGRAHASPGFIGGWLGKAGGLAMRLALILEHLWWAWIDPPADDPLHLPPATISLAATRAAMRLVDDWAEPMARRVAASATASPTENDAATLARWLRRRHVTQFNAREARRSPDGPGGRLNQSAAMNAACGALVEAALIRRVATEGHKGRRPNDFEVNPLLLEKGVPP